MIGRVLREVAFFVLFLAAAIVLTWPLARHLSTAVSDLGDPLLNAWILDWVSYALTHHPLHLFDAPIFYPSTMPLAFSENLIGIALVTLPFHLAGIPPLSVYNLAMLLGFAHAGYGAFVLARLVTRNARASVFAGIFFAFVSYKFDHLAHVQIIWSGWLPLLLAGLLAYWERPALGRAALVFGAFVMNGLTNIHFLLFGSLAVALTMLFMAIVLPWRGWRFWTPLVAALALGSAVLLPVLFPYRIVSREYGMKRIVDEVRNTSATWGDWLTGSPRSAIYSKISDPQKSQHERRLFPGALALFLLAVAILMKPRGGGSFAPSPPIRPGLLRALDVTIAILAAAAWIGATTYDFSVDLFGRTIVGIKSSDIPAMLLILAVVVRLTLRFPSVLGGSEGRSLRTALTSSRFTIGEWTGVLWMLIGLLGSFGMHGFFHAFLFQRIEPFQSIRTPARWAVIAYVGLAIWVAVGALVLLQRRRWVIGVLALLAAADVWSRIRYEYALPDPPPVYRWLARNRIGPMLELPLDDNWGGPFRYVFFSTAHHVPILNGTSGFDTPLHSTLRQEFQSGPDDDFFNLVERSGARTVLVHADPLSQKTEATWEWLARQISLDRMRFMRRFDNGVGGDWLFALNRNFPDWERWSEPAVSREEKVRKFLRGEPVYNASTFGRVESPEQWTSVPANLRVQGWVLSPHGVRRVTLRVAGGKLQIPMTRFERPDVLARYPWYANNPTPGFIYEFPKRPRGIPGETEVQVEVEDGKGEVTRFPDLVVFWP